MSSLIEDELRAAFTERAENVPQTPDPYDRTSRAIARSRYRRAMGASALAVALIAGGAVAVNLSASDQPSRTTHLVDPDPTPTVHGDAAWAQWPIRGSLAEDETFLRLFLDSLPEFGIDPSAQRQVLFAGDVDAKRVAIAYVRTGDHALLVERSGPRGAGVTELRAFNKTQPVQTVSMFTDIVDGGTELTLLADPGVDRLEIYDGEAWREVALTDGLAVIELPGTHRNDVHVRAYSGGQVVFDDAEAMHRGEAEQSQAELRARAWQEMIKRTLDGTPYAADAPDISWAMRQLGDSRHLSIDTMAVHVVWTGELFPGRQEPQPAVVFVLRPLSGSTAYQLIVDRWDGWFPHVIQPVSAKDADRLPAVWLTNPQDLNACVAAIAVPEGGLPVSTAEVWLDGTARATAPLKVGGVTTVDRCGGESLDVAPTAIRMRDSSGNVLVEWSEAHGLALVGASH